MEQMAPKEQPPQLNDGKLSGKKDRRKMVLWKAGGALAWPHRRGKFLFEKCKQGSNLSGSMTEGVCVRFFFERIG